MMKKVLIINEDEPQAKPQNLQTVFILHRTQSRGRSEPPMNNGAIFARRIAPSFFACYGTDITDFLVS